MLSSCMVLNTGITIKINKRNNDSFNFSRTNTGFQLYIYRSEGMAAKDTA